MTHDEAVKLGASASMKEAGMPTSYKNEVIAHNFIAVAVALGMLKLDEPKSRFTPAEIAMDVLEHYYFRNDFEKAKSVLTRLECAGLKLVSANGPAR